LPKIQTGRVLYLVIERNRSLPAYGLVQRRSKRTWLVMPSLVSILISESTKLRMLERAMAEKV